MLDHHIQRSIVYDLAFKPHATFTDLKPGTVDNKLFTYHLKKTVQAGYVEKKADGTYALTAEGRRLSTGVQESQQALITERPLSALFLVIRRKHDGAWLLYERKTHPMLGYRGFMHCRPNAGDNVAQTAATRVRQKTGLSCVFTPLGGGYIRTFMADELESFTHFTLLYCDDAEGDLQLSDTQASYFWVSDIQEDEQLFPATQLLKDKYEQKQPFFTEQTYTI